MPRMTTMVLHILLVLMSFTMKRTEGAVDCFDYDIDYFGFDLEEGVYDSVDSALDCQHSCQSKAGCQFWTWDQSYHGACWHKSALGESRKSPGLISGPRYCGDVTTPNPGGDLTSWPNPLIWSDEFDGSSIDESKWTHFVSGWRGGNHEFQYYRNNRKNSYIDNGVLVMKPSLTADEFGEDFIYDGELNLWEEGCTDSMNIDGGCIIKAGGDYIVNPIQSAKLVSNHKFSTKFGIIEVRAKVPKGDWLWPAIWMLPEEWAYGGWPMSGEIDLMESKGNLNLMCDGRREGHQKMGSTMHWGPDSGNNHFWQTHWDKTNTSVPFGDDYHVYVVIWDHDGLTFFVDGENIGGVYPPAGGFWELGGFHGNNLWESGEKVAPFDRSFYILLNVAVGGNFFGDGCDNENGDKPWYGQFVPGSMKRFWEARDDWIPTWNMNTDDSAMKIDYVRVYSI